MSEKVSDYSLNTPPRTAGKNVPRDRRWSLAVLALAQFMVVLDATITNIALPDIGRALHIDPAGLAWVITAYVVAFGGLLPFGGRLADLLGPRRTFAGGMALFTAASLAAGLAPSSGALIASRAVQGAGAALLAPAALALVTRIFPAAAERAKALSVWGAVAAGGSAAGVLIGGLLTGGLGWRSVFLINVPVGLVVLAATARTIPAFRPHRGGRPGAGRFDLPGALAATGGLALLVTALSEGETWGWSSPATIGAFAAAGLLLAAFVAIESRTRHPLMPLRLLRLRTVAAGNAIMLATGAAMFAAFYFLSLYEQLVLGYGAVATGLSQLPLAAALVLAAGGAAPLLARFGSRAVLGAALVTFAAGLAWLGVAGAGAGAGGTFLGTLLGPTILVGAGLGAAFVPVTALAVAGVPAADAGIAGGLVNTAQQVGGALGLAALVALATARTAVASPSGAPDALAQGYAWAFLAAAGVALAAALVTFLAVRRDDATTGEG